MIDRAWNPHRDTIRTREQYIRAAADQLVRQQRTVETTKSTGRRCILESELRHLERFGGQQMRASGRPRAGGGFPRTGARSGAGNRRPDAIDAVLGAGHAAVGAPDSGAYK